MSTAMTTTNPCFGSNHRSALRRKPALIKKLKSDWTPHIPRTDKEAGPCLA